MVGVETFRRGLRNGLLVSWQLAKVTVPVYAAVTILKHTPVLPWIASYCSPALSLVGLPGEASLALVLGYVVNLYAAIGAILSLALTPEQITVIAIMLLLAHSLPVECAVARRAGVSAALMLAVRLGLSVGSGMLFNLIL